MALTHLDAKGNARMVDISAKESVRRTAMAVGTINMMPSTIRMIRKNLLKKGDAIATARIAGISAAKKTAELIPLCHNIRIEKVDVDFEFKKTKIVIKASAVCTDKTGIEMEALIAVSLAALTLYDMCKAVDRKMVISDIKLIKKTKG